MRAREKTEVWEERVEEMARSGMGLKAYAAKIGVDAVTDVGGDHRAALDARRVARRQVHWLPWRDRDAGWSRGFCLIHT